MVIKVVWTEFAINELKDIFNYYKTKASKTIAKRIKSKILASTRNLSEQPLIGQEEENLIELKQNHIYIVEGNYKIIYFLDENIIYITDVFDCRQDPEKMKR